MKHASVYSGIGGPEVAAAMLGWDNVFHCEINPFGRAVLDYWFPNAKSYANITKTDFSEWWGRVDVLTGGFPCQPFSYAGQRRGADDDRYLWPHMFRCIDQVRPTWVVAENVAGILTMVEQGEASEMESNGTLFDEGDGVRRYRLVETFTLQRICDDLESHGYEVQTVLIPACAVGAPHRRDRVFIVARRVTADTRSEGLERAGGQRVQSDEGRGCTTEDNEPARTADEVGESEDGEIWRTISDSYIDRLERNLWPYDGVHPQAGLSAEELTDRYGNLRSEHRWEYFPTVSPVHRGNDGLPFPLDNLAIPASKWRTESLKAYGNAIVPQVMYEIFRAIEIVEQENL